MIGVTTENGLSDVIQTMRSLKGKVSKIYENMGSFIITTTKHMGDFRTMITPYAKYFYPAEDGANSDDCFISEVVVPSRNDLSGAIDRAVSIMTGDQNVNDNVSHAIEDVLGLTESVDTILNLIDEIDIYSENMLIISTKYGEEGMALARISNEMSSMAQVVNGIGVKLRDYLEKLDVSRQDFSAVRERIDVISENYLTKMKLDISMKFNEMMNELKNVSEMVNGILSGSNELESSMKSFVINIQMEDIIRQKIEKILFYLDDSGIEAGRESRVSEEDFGPVIMHVVSEQLADIMNDITGQNEEVHRCCTQMSGLLNTVQVRLNKSGEMVDENELNRMDLVYHRIESLKSDYINYMEDIISGKKKLLHLSMTIIEVLNEFERLFGGISDLIRRFESLNMITRIELARHSVLSRKLGGALTSVMTLPEKMKVVLEQSITRYQGIRKNMVDAVAQYSANFKLQEEVLAGCIGSMKKVSVKLYESQKYYWDISNEIERCCRKVLKFNDENCNNIGLLETGESLRDVMAIVHAYCETEYGDYRFDAEAERQRLLQTAVHNGENSVLAELSRELGTEKTKDNVIIF